MRLKSFIMLLTQNYSFVTWSLLILSPSIVFDSACPNNVKLNDYFENDICMNAKCGSVKPVRADVDLNTDVPPYIQHIVKCNCIYYECLKMISFRYRYVVSKLQEKGYKKDIIVVNGPVTVSDLDQSNTSCPRILLQ